MKAYLHNLVDRLRTSFWFLPALFAALALVLAIVMVWLDTTVSLKGSQVFGWLTVSDVEGARQLLVVIGGSMITVAGVVFSITIVALSMASAQFGPKLLRNYMRDRGNQIVLGTFIADFVYCLMLLRYVRDGFVPFLAVNLSILLALASLGVLIYFFHHIASMIQADNIVASLGHELSNAIDQWMEDNRETLEQDHHGDTQARDQNAGSQGIVTIPSPTSGYLQSIDYAGLVQLAERHDICIKVDRRAGHFVIKGAALITYTPTAREREAIREAALKALIFGRERSSLQDIEYVIDQINQVAARALSPSLNDPYTAMVCADWLSAGITRLTGQDFPPSHRYDHAGRLRVVCDSLTFEGVVNTAFDEFRQSARPLTSVSMRLLEAIASILKHTQDEGRRTALSRQAELIHRASKDSLPEESDREDLNRRYREVLKIIAAEDNIAEGSASRHAIDRG